LNGESHLGETLHLFGLFGFLAPVLFVFFGGELSILDGFPPLAIFAGWIESISY